MAKVDADGDDVLFYVQFINIKSTKVNANTYNADILAICQMAKFPSTKVRWEEIFAEIRKKGQVNNFDQFARSNCAD